MASSTRSGVERYLCASNRRSSPQSCPSEKTVRAFLRRQCFEASDEKSVENERPSIYGMKVQVLPGCILSF